jgi:hypothetical protein
VKRGIAGLSITAKVHIFNRQSGFIIQEGTLYPKESIHIQGNPRKALNDENHTTLILLLAASLSVQYKPDDDNIGLANDTLIIYMGDHGIWNRNVRSW